jgi:hypothetical protein
LRPKACRDPSSLRARHIRPPLEVAHHSCDGLCDGPRKGCGILFGRPNAGNAETPRPFFFLSLALPPPRRQTRHATVNIELYKLARAMFYKRASGNSDRAGQNTGQTPVNKTRKPLISCRWPAGPARLLEHWAMVRFALARPHGGHVMTPWASKRYDPRQTRGQRSPLEKPSPPSIAFYQTEKEKHPSPFFPRLPALSRLRIRRSFALAGRR